MKNLFIVNEIILLLVIIKNKKKSLLQRGIIKIILVVKKWGRKKTILLITTVSKCKCTMNSKNAISTDNDYWGLDGTLKGRILSRTFYYEQQYRVVFYITDTTILSGDGSSSNPYNVEEDWAWVDSYQVIE